MWSLWRVLTSPHWFLEEAATRWRMWLAAGPTRQPCYWTLKSATNCLTLVRRKINYKWDLLLLVSLYRVLWIFWAWLHPSPWRQHQDWEPEHPSVPRDDPGNGHRQSPPPAPLAECTDATCTTGHAQHGGYHGNQPWWTEPTKWTRCKVTRMKINIISNSDINLGEYYDDNYQCRKDIDIRFCLLIIIPIVQSSTSWRVLRWRPTPYSCYHGNMTPLLNFFVFIFSC